MSIKKIIETESNLNSKRRSYIANFIKNIAANPRIQAQRVPAIGNKVIFCVSDNRVNDANQFNSNSGVNDLFKTINSKFKASYYEIWDKVDNSKQDYCLNRMYFHLYLIGDNREDKEYILLHTDPKDPDITHGNYKRSPHLHIKQSCDDIIPHAHFALNINDYDIALSSLLEVNKCFKNHIDMLAHQILR